MQSMNVVINYIFADSNAFPKFPEGYFCIRTPCLKFSFELAVDMKRRIEI